MLEIVIAANVVSVFCIDIFAREIIFVADNTALETNPVEPASVLNPQRPVKAIAPFE